jgi:hypothetical protein
MEGKNGVGTYAARVDGTGSPPGVSTGVLPEESTGVGASAARVGGAGTSPGALTGV